MKKRIVIEIDVEEENDANIVRDEIEEILLNGDFDFLDADFSITVSD